MVESSGKPASYVLCHHCDLLSELPSIANQYKAVCPRCNTRLARGRSNMKLNTIVYSLCSLFMLAMTCCFIFIHIRVMGITNSLNILAIPDILYRDNYMSLMLLFLLFVLLFPAITLIIQIVVCSKIPLSKYRKRDLLIVYEKLQSWCMPEIFMAGVLVSFVKLTSYGDIGIDRAFWSFCFFIIFYLKASIDFSIRKIWNELATNNFVKTELKSGKTGMSQQVRLCLCCHAMLPAEQRHCPRCKQKGQVRERNKIQWTLALLVTSLILYIPANLFGVMNTIFVGSASSSTILDGVIYMWKDGDYPVALVIFTASVIIPILKIIALTWLCYFASMFGSKRKRDCIKMNKLYNVVEFIGRWSMIDIFVVSIISALIRNGEMMAVYPDVGAIFFAIVVIITMIASHQYDPRLIWDKR